jgi:eukaryotic-like serine/threonine-protein kinase
MSARCEIDVIGKRVGNYVIERRLAHGAMGTVFIARHPTLGRQVAVKFLGRDEETPADHSKRFMDEACITANLHHPNIVDIFDFGDLDGRYYYTMELLSGCDLAALIRREGRFDCQQVQAYVLQICAGLDAAHGVGVVHRDLKPSNIFVVDEHPTRIKLMDFGVAKVLSAGVDHTRQGQIIGTPRYMSPEQALGQIDQITPRSDIYSLGVIVYEMLTGVPVFEHDSPMMLLVMHIRDDIRPIRDRCPHIPPQVARLIETCLSKRPEQRPASARELAERFNEALREASRYNQQASSHPERSEVDLPPTVAQPPADARQTAALAVPETPSSREPKVTSETTIEHPKDAATGTFEAAPVQNQPWTLEQAVASVATEEAQPAESAAQVPMANQAQGVQQNGTAPAALHLTKADRSTLNKLWLRMQRGGDFPAFVRNVGEVSKRADFESSYSATQLGDSILKDFALTAKLLKVVNSAYASRFGGKVYSVQHAIVILGFDRVRSLALSISLFKSRGTDEHSRRMSESAINSLVSGELSQQLAPYAGVNDEEQAMMCGMFRNLGRHLAIVYLPDLYEQITELMRLQGVSLHAAAERVLGLSLQKLGIGVAERWRLPKPILRTMSAMPGMTGHCSRQEDRLVALADFANELCDVVAGSATNQRGQAITNLLVRHKDLLSIDQDTLAELLQSVEQSFEQRYATLLGLDAKSSCFSRSVSTMVSQPENDVRDQTGSRISPTHAEALVEADAAGMKRGPHTVSIHTGAARPRPQPQRIQLAKVEVSNGRKNLAGSLCLIDGSGSAADKNLERIGELSVALDREGRSDRLLSQIIRTFAESLDIATLLVLRANSSRNELVIAGGLRDDLEALTKEFRVPLLPSRASGDVFSQAYHQSKDIVVGDAFEVRANATVPLRYYETIGSPAFALYSCVGKGAAPVLVLVDGESSQQLPSQTRLLKVVELRPLLARAIG